MEVDLLTLVEMRYDKQALASYEAAYQVESEGAVCLTSWNFHYGAPSFYYSLSIQLCLWRPMIGGYASLGSAYILLLLS